MSTVRLRRLKADSAKLQEYARRHPRVRIVQMDGDPPERYQLEYRINSLRMVGGELQPVQSHLVEITLPLNYPRLPPQCRMLSPVFHPNIAPHAICVGDHWGAGESLESLIIRIGEMLAYQSYNVKSPLNGEAARWVEENKHRVPLDPVSMLPEEDQTATTPPVRQPAPATAGGALGSQPPPSQQRVQVKCPQCGSAYRVAATILGRNVRCKTCDQVFACAAWDPNV
jgi:predicted Zn finger-like uncharacterized protein